jgi:hypothetical protein
VVRVTVKPRRRTPELRLQYLRGGCVTDSTLSPEDPAGGESSYDADVDEAYDDDDELAGGTAGFAADQVDPDVGTSHDADIAAGYDDDDTSDLPDRGDGVDA